MKKLSFILVLAVLTFGFMATITSCHNSLTGTDPLLVQTGQELPARVQRLSACNAQAGAGGSALTYSTKSINVYFNVKNGGLGMLGSYGMVSTIDGSYFNYNSTECFASNYSVSLVVPSEETCLLISWECGEFLRGWTSLSARLNLVPGVTDYTILLNFNGRGKVATEGLTDVIVWKSKK